MLACSESGAIARCSQGAAGGAQACRGAVASGTIHAGIHAHGVREEGIGEDAEGVVAREGTHCCSLRVKVDVRKACCLYNCDE